MDMTENMKTFLFIALKAHLEGKPGGAFGSHTHTGDAPKLIFDTMEFVYRMDVVKLGPIPLNKAKVNNPEGIHSNQDYGKAICKKIA
jgi:hypothetical protein